MNEEKLRDEIFKLVKKIFELRSAKDTFNPCLLYTSPSPRD